MTGHRLFTPSMNRFHKSDPLVKAARSESSMSLSVQRKGAANVSGATLTREMQSRPVTLTSMPSVAGKSMSFTLR